MTEKSEFDFDDIHIKIYSISVQISLTVVNTAVIQDTAPKSKGVLLYGLRAEFSHRYHSRYGYSLAASLLFQTADSRNIVPASLSISFP